MQLDVFAWTSEELEQGIEFLFTEMHEKHLPDITFTARARNIETERNVEEKGDLPVDNLILSNTLQEPNVMSYLIQNNYYLGNAPGFLVKPNVRQATQDQQPYPS